MPVSLRLLTLSVHAHVEVSCAPCCWFCRRLRVSYPGIKRSRVYGWEVCRSSSTEPSRTRRRIHASDSASAATAPPPRMPSSEVWPCSGGAAHCVQWPCAPGPRLPGLHTVEQMDTDENHGDGAHPLDPDVRSTVTMGHPSVSIALVRAVRSLVNTRAGGLRSSDYGVVRGAGADTVYGV